MLPVDWIETHRDLAAWIMFAFVVFVIMPGHVWWYKHKDRPLFSAWLTAVPIYVLVLTPAALLFRFWRPILEALQIPAENEQIARLAAMGLVIVIANVAWVFFLRYLKRPPA